MIGMLIKLAPVVFAVGAAAQGGDKLGGLMSPVLNVARTMRAQSEISGMVKVLRLDLIADQPLPRNFSAYLERNMDSQGGDVTLDPWETPYQLVKEDGAVIVRSCGPDAEADTEDDLFRTVMDRSGRFR